MTCAVLLSLLHKVMMSSCSQDQARHIRRDFGDKVVLVVGEKLMNSVIHFHTVLEELVIPFAAELREKPGLPTTASVMHMVDEAPCHTGDKCHKDKST